jgi:hypothetical protein
MTPFEEQARLAQLLPDIARTIDRMIKDAGLPPQPWSLYTWGGNRCQYISNVERDQSRAAMRETLARWDEPLDPPLASFS